MASKPPSSANPLPSGWKEAFDSKYGRWYFYNPSTKQSQWHHPGQTAEKKAVWVEKFDQRYNKPFWYNRKTKQSSWTKPAEEPAFTAESSEPQTKRTPTGTKIEESIQQEQESSKGVAQQNDELGEQAELQTYESAASDAATVDSSSTKASRSLILETASPQTSRFPRKSSESTESIASPVTARVKLDERRKLTLKALASSQSSTSDELLSIDSEATRFTPTHSVSSPISMPPKSPHRKRGPDSTRVQMESTHLASSFNTDRDRAFKDGGLFGKQKLAAMQRSSAEDIKLSSRSSDSDRRHYSSKVPSNESLLEPTSPVEAPVVRVPVGAHTAEGSEAAEVTLNERRASRVPARPGAFSSILNPSGNKKPPVILTSRPAFSSLHQRRMGGSKSPQNYFPTLSSGEEAPVSDNKATASVLEASTGNGEYQEAEELPQTSVQTDSHLDDAIGNVSEPPSLTSPQTHQPTSQTGLFTDFRRDLGQILNADVEPDSGESGFDESETGSQKDIDELGDGSDLVSRATSDASGRESGLSSIRSSLDESRLSQSLQVPQVEDAEGNEGNEGVQLQEEPSEGLDDYETRGLLDKTELVESGDEGHQFSSDEQNSAEGSVVSAGDDADSEQNLDQTVLLPNRSWERLEEKTDHDNGAVEPDARMSDDEAGKTEDDEPDSNHQQAVEPDVPMARDQAEGTDDDEKVNDGQQQAVEDGDGVAGDEVEEVDDDSDQQQPVDPDVGIAGDETEETDDEIEPDRYHEQPFGMADGEAEETDDGEEPDGNQRHLAVHDGYVPKENVASEGEDMSGDSDWTNVQEPIQDAQSPVISSEVEEKTLSPHQSIPDSNREEVSDDADAENDGDLVHIEQSTSTEVAHESQQPSIESMENPFDDLDGDGPTEIATGRESPAEPILPPKVLLEEQENDVIEAASSLASTDQRNPFDIEAEGEQPVAPVLSNATDDEEQLDSGRRSSVYHILERQQSLKERLAALSKRSRPKLPSRDSDAQRSLARTSSAQAIQTTSADLLASEDEDMQPRKRAPSRTSSYLDMMKDTDGNTLHGEADEVTMSEEDQHEQVGSKRPASFAKSSSVKDMVAKLSAKAGSSGNLPIQFGLPPKQPSGVFAVHEESLNEPQLREAPAPPADPNAVGQAPILERRSSVKELVAKITKQSSSSALPIRFSSLPNVELPEGLAGTGTGSQRFSLPELQSQSQSDLLNEAHMSRARIPAGLRREPSRRTSNFAGGAADG